MTLQVRIQLRNIKRPPVWRRIVIPGTFTFLDFHYAIQRAFGWTDSHLFHFMKQPYDRGWEIKMPDSWDGSLFSSPYKAAHKTVVADFLRENGVSEFVYTYDFGDDWFHDIQLEAINEEESLESPRCLAGKGACPPEDCGGPWGYENLKALFQEEPDSDEALEYKAWMGLDEDEEFDPKLFDLEETNEVLASVKHLSARDANRIAKWYEG